jgi:hypothetical protein
MMKIEDQVGQVLADATNISNQGSITITNILIRECKCGDRADCYDRSVELEGDIICSCNYHRNNMKMMALAQVWNPMANVTESSSLEKAQENVF